MPTDTTSVSPLGRISDGFLAVDTDWRITYANGAARELVDAGADADALDGEPLWEVLPAPLGSDVRDKYEEAMATGERLTFEAHSEPLATWLDVRLYPSEDGLSVLLYDVADRRETYDTLTSRERVLREMYDIIADRERPFTGKVEALLELGRRRLGTDYGTLSRFEGDDYVFEVVSADDDSIQAGDVVPLSATNCEIAASREETLVLGDIARDAPEETDRAGYTEWGISCYLGGPVFVDDQVYGTFCFYDTESRADQFSDWEVTLVDLMSRWVSYELQRERTTERLARQNEKLERFASIVSHDLRSPLGLVSGSVELAKETGDLTQLDRCERAVERMNTLIDDLLTMARAGKSIDEQEPVVVSELVTESWQTLQTADATLDNRAEQTVRDRTRLRQLFENLIRNSVQHGGDSVTVTVDDLPDGFAVGDDGPGIPTDERDRVFESGYSTREDGTGLGLSIVAEIAEAHGWTVDATESADGGARVEVTGVDIVDGESDESDEE
jgi:nitrogen-specific signal transduction histidine kinase